MLILLLLLVLAVLPPPPTSDCAFVPPATLHPGDVVLVTARCSAPPSEFRARLAGRDVHFFPLLAGDTEASPPTTEENDETSLAALIGIDLAARPGLADLTWEADFGDDESGRGKQIFRIDSRRFPVQRLTLSRQFVEPDAATLVRIADERRRLLEVLARTTPERLWRGAFETPLPGAAGNGFGARRILNGRPAAPHAGLDLPAPTGTPVWASNSGVVALVDTLFYAGKTVVLDHGLGLFTVYSHLSQTAVLESDPVGPGQFIGRVGATGRVTAAHLHWGTHLNGARVDPVALMSATAGTTVEPPALRQPTRQKD